MEKRIEYIDILRGVTMLLVVYSHVDIHLLGSVTPSALNSLFVSFRMPLFFFISGFFIYSERYDLALLRRRTVNRLGRQLYPTLLFFLLYVVAVKPYSLKYYLYDPHKAGYWFTLVAVEYFLLVAPVLLTLSSAGAGRRGRTLTLGILMAVAAAGDILMNECTWIGKMPAVKLTSFPLFVRYMQYVLAGCMARLWWPELRRSLFRIRMLPLYAALFAAGYLFAGRYVAWLTPYPAILLLLTSASLLPGSIYATGCGRALTATGTSTLEIYLMHYFIIRLLAGVSFLKNVLLPLRDTIWEFPAFMTVSVAVTAICVLTVGIFKRIRIYPLFFRPRMAWPAGIQ